MLRPQNGGTMEMLWRSMPAAIDRRGLREEAFQDVIADGVVLLMKRGMRDAGHDSELLVRVGQPLEELHEVGKARDAVVLAAHDEGRHRDFLGITDRQIGAHIDISAGRHGVVELEDGVGERLDDDVIGGARMVALERTNLRSIGRRFLARNSGSRLLRSASVGEPSPVHTMASSASRATISGWRCANKAARNAPDEIP